MYQPGDIVQHRLTGQSLVVIADDGVRCRVRDMFYDTRKILSVELERLHVDTKDWIDQLLGVVSQAHDYVVMAVSIPASWLLTLDADEVSKAISVPIHVHIGPQVPIALVGELVSKG